MQKLDGQHLAVYGTSVLRVDEEIRRNNAKFKISPIGPIGQYVKLRGEATENTNLSQLIEIELGEASIRAYLCDNDHDRLGGF